MFAASTSDVNASQMQIEKVGFSFQGLVPWKTAKQFKFRYVNQEEIAPW